MNVGGRLPAVVSCQPSRSLRLVFPPELAVLSGGAVIQFPRQ